MDTIGTTEMHEGVSIPGVVLILLLEVAIVLLTDCQILTWLAKRSGA